MRVELYYSIGSRYSYLAFTQLDRIERETGCRFELQPISSAALLARRGSDPFEGAPVSGQYDWAYRERDATRWAAYYDVPFVEPRGRVAFDSGLLARACHAALRLGRLREASTELFAAMFHGDTLRLDADACTACALRAGLDEASFRAALDAPETAHALESTLERAERQGVFGVPTFVAGEESFWGNDRLVLLERLLQSVA